MGKRKSSKAPPKKSRAALATTFTCLFCNHDGAVSVKMDKKVGVGDLYCKVCGQRFQASVNYLSAPVDVYSEWLDACEEVAQQAAAQDMPDKVTEEDKQFSSYANEPRKMGNVIDDDDEEDAAYDADD